MPQKIILKEQLLLLRQKASVTQEKLADAMGVSRQSVQKWESGAALPDPEKIAALADFFDVSLDFLMQGREPEAPTEKPLSKPLLPDYEKPERWEAYYEALPIEFRQCLDEGLDVEEYRDLFFALDRLPNGKAKADMADILYEMIGSLSKRADYPYCEPDDWDSIRAACEAYPFRYPAQGVCAMKDKLKGAWYGRICGCLLGKSVEGILRSELKPLLERSGNFPLHRYITQSDVPAAEALGLRFPLAQCACAEGKLPGMPPDDDTNYVVMAFRLLSGFGRDFTSGDVASLWLRLQPKNAYCTAERVAYRNFVNGFRPPVSAQYKNPYREWIGAQIRGDFFGWICPGRPEEAASMAYRDARISHVKNGLYGEMWVSAMLAAAGGGADIPSAIRIGLSCIPRDSRLNRAIEKVLHAYETGQSADDFFADFHTRWDDTFEHDWCHTISNAEIVTASLLWGEGDYARSICLAVSQAFDTDCNGATVGSVIGLAKGFKALPSEWTDKVSSTLFTDIFGFEKVSIDEMAAKTYDMLR